MREHAAGAKAQLSPESHPISRSALRYDCKRHRPHAAGGVLQHSVSSCVIGCTRVLVQTPYAGSFYGTTWVQLLAYPNAFAIRSEAQDSGGARHQAVCLCCLRKLDILPGVHGDRCIAHERHGHSCARHSWNGHDAGRRATMST